MLHFQKFSKKIFSQFWLETTIKGHPYQRFIATVYRLRSYKKGLVNIETTLNRLHTTNRLVAAIEYWDLRCFSPVLFSSKTHWNVFFYYFKLTNFYKIFSWDRVYVSLPIGTMYGLGSKWPSLILYRINYNAGGVICVGIGGGGGHMKQLSQPPSASSNYYFSDRLSPQPKFIFVQRIPIAMVQSSHSEVFIQRIKNICISEEKSFSSFTRSYIKDLKPLI